MKKRILSLLLALALVLTGVPMAFATESGFADGNVPEISTDGPVQLPSSNIAEDPTVETDAQQPVEAGEPKLVQNGEDRFPGQNHPPHKLRVCRRQQDRHPRAEGCRL